MVELEKARNRGVGVGGLGGERRLLTPTVCPYAAEPAGGGGSGGGFSNSRALSLDSKRIPQMIHPGSSRPHPMTSRNLPGSPQPFTTVQRSALTISRRCPLLRHRLPLRVGEEWKELQMWRLGKDGRSRLA